MSKQYYNLAGWTTKTIENYVNGTPSDADDKTVEYTHNGNGQVKTLKANLTSGYQATENVFGISGGLVSNDIVAAVKHPDTSSGNPSSSEQESYTYNQLGQVSTYTDRNGSVHTYAYDVLGRVTSDAITTLGSGVDGTVRRIETAYDTQGNAYLFTSYDAATSGNIVNQVQREFNGLGQLITEWQAVGGAVNTSTSPKVQYAYSFSASGSMNHSRLTSMTYPNGRVITFNYASGLSDNISRLSSITDGSTTLESYEYLGYGTVVKRGHAQPGVDLTFIKQSGESNADAGDQYIGLDRFGRIADQRWRTSSTELDRRQYGYDRDSNRLYFDNLVETTRDELYAYDGLNQIISFDRGTLNGTKDGISGSPSRNQDWDFDALGNWDSLTTDGGSAVTRTHNKQNEITGISGATTPTYDANGNLTTDETGRTFKYDAFNRLVEVRDSGSTLLATYRYDALGRRIRETRGSTTTDLYYSAAWQVLEERVGSDVKVSYVWSPVYVDAMIARDRDTDANGSLDERLYALHDANFNIVALVDTSGNVVEHYAYDAFGGFVVLTPSWGSRGSSSYDWKHFHQGLKWDADLGGLDDRNRILGPSIGRFFQGDPLRFGSGDPNFCRLVANNPLARLDPSGLIMFLEPIGMGEMPGRIANNVDGLLAMLEQLGILYLHWLNRDLDGAFVGGAAFVGGILDDWLPSPSLTLLPNLIARPFLNELEWADRGSYNRGRRSGPLTMDLATIATMVLPIKACRLPRIARSPRVTNSPTQLPKPRTMGGDTGALPTRNTGAITQPGTPPATSGPSSSGVGGYKYVDKWGHSHDYIPPREWPLYSNDPYPVQWYPHNWTAPIHEGPRPPGPLPKN